MTGNYDATWRMFFTTELLEAILLQVDMVTLLISALRVNKTWHDVITNSVAIQQALYFIPISSTNSKSSRRSLDSAPGCHSVPTRQEIEDTTPELNPLLVKKFTRLFFDFSGEHGYVRRASSFYTLPWSSKPDEEVEMIDSYESPWRTIRKQRRLDVMSTREEDIARRRFTRKGASWRRILVSQPPPLQIGYLSPDVSNMNESPLFGRRVWKALVTPITVPSLAQGLRMGLLYDYVQHHAGHHALHSLWFRIHWMHPREPFRTELSREVCTDLFASTCIVIEMVDMDDWMLADHYTSPADVAEFDMAYRCDEASIMNIKLEEVIKEWARLGNWEHEAYVRDQDLASRVWRGWRLYNVL